MCRVLPVVSIRTKSKPARRGVASNRGRGERGAVPCCSLHDLLPTHSSDIVITSGGFTALMAVSQTHTQKFPFCLSVLQGA